MEFETKLTPVRIGLTQMLQALWDEIAKASIAAQERNEGRFAFEEAEVEVAVEVEAKSETEFDLFVAKFGAGLTGTRTATLRIKLKQWTEAMAQTDPGKWVFVDEMGSPTSRAIETKPRSRDEARRVKGAKPSGAT